MHYLLLDLAAFAVGTYGLVVDAVLLTVPLEVDASDVDDDSFVVSIINTTDSKLGVNRRFLLVVSPSAGGGRYRSCCAVESRPVGCARRTPSYPCVQPLCPSSRL